MISAATPNNDNQYNQFGHRFRKHVSFNVLITASAMRLHCSQLGVVVIPKKHVYTYVHRYKQVYMYIIIYIYILGYEYVIAFAAPRDAESMYIQQL